MEKYRTFIAVPLRVGTEFLHARDVLMAKLGQERISWVDPDRYHVTIRFLGDTSQEEIAAIGNALLKHVNTPERGELDLHQAGSFGPRKKPRVVWVGFKDQALFEKLKAGVDDALEACGIPTVAQPFRAHLTLGRIRSLKNLQGYDEVISSMKDGFSGKVGVERLVFYRSELRSGGPLYTPIEEVVFNNQTR
jgi:2'-5' RNA ligase